MPTSAQKKLIYAFAKKRARKNDFCHSISHLEETAGLAIMLAKAEGADPDLCWAAAMLHDICKADGGNHGTEGAIEARKFLLKIGVGKKEADAIFDAVHFHNKEFRGGPLLRQILWDADKLQIIGPYYFLKRHIAYWIWKKGFLDGANIAIKEYYFYEKRFKTKTAKRIVKLHSKLMHAFLSSFKNELKRRGELRA